MRSSAEPRSATDAAYASLLQRVPGGAFCLLVPPIFALLACAALARARDLRGTILLGRSRFGVSLAAGIALGIACGFITAIVALGAAAFHPRPELMAPLVFGSLAWYVALIVVVRLTFSAGVQTLSMAFGGRVVGAIATALLETLVMMPALTLRVDTPPYPPPTPEQAYVHGFTVFGQAVLGPLLYATIRATSGSLVATACAQFALYLTFVIFL